MLRGERTANRQLGGDGSDNAIEQDILRKIGHSTSTAAPSVIWEERFQNQIVVQNN